MPHELRALLAAAGALVAAVVAATLAEIAWQERQRWLYFSSPRRPGRSPSAGR
jgi:hypothetical protein